MGAMQSGQYVKAIGGAQVDTDGVKRYAALLSQSGTDAPVATVLENSLGGTVVWAREEEGNYFGTLAGVFTADKTIVTISNGVNATVAGSRVDGDTIAVFAPDDSQIGKATIVVCVYPS